MFPEYATAEENSIKYKCTSYNINYSNKIDKEVKKRFKNTFKISNNDVQKIILPLRKSVYPYEYMDEWEKFNEISLSEKEYFYKKINMEDITDADYTQKEFVKNLK